MNIAIRKFLLQGKNQKMPAEFGLWQRAGTSGIKVEMEGRLLHSQKMRSKETVLDTEVQ